MNEFKFEETFKLSNGSEVTLDWNDMYKISHAYNILCTQEYLLDNHPNLSVEEAYDIAAEVRRQMDKYDITEDFAIDEVLKEKGIVTDNND